jgi:hypothetical protein
MIEVVTRVASLSRSQNGGVTGQVFLRGAARDFPDSEWSDFPVVILGWWIVGLESLADATVDSFEAHFMEGPYSFVLTRDAGDVGRLEWCSQSERVSVGTVSIRALRNSALVAGRLVSDACRVRGWSGRELDELESAISLSSD